MTEPARNSPNARSAAPASACGQWAVVQAEAIRIGADEATECFGELRTGFPGRSARRMSHLGLMLGSLIRQIGIDEAVTVFYATSYGEGRTLETYLASFPQASPLGFQSSIPPSGVEQVLILDRQPVQAFFPLVGSSEDLPLSLLQGLRLSDAAQRVLLLGGEENCEWLKDYRLAAHSDFAFALLLEPATTASAATRLGILHHNNALTERDIKHTPADAKAGDNPPAKTVARHHNVNTIPTSAAAQQIGHSPNNVAVQQSGTMVQQPDATAQCSAADGSAPETISKPSLAALCEAVAIRQPLRFAHPDRGTWTLDWNPADAEPA